MKAKMMWCCMVQLGMRMWINHGVDQKMKFDRAFWQTFSEKLSACGCNSVVLDIGEGIQYDSCPELAVSDAYTKEEMREELRRLRSLGIEVIPKLNFSTAHNMWMGNYSRMVSTKAYYKFCEDIIDETCELFRPAFFHVGMDEETYEIEKDYDYMVLRQNDLWWHDLYHITSRVERNGARAIVWADYARQRPEEFVAKLPKSVIPSVWYYFDEFDNFSEEKYRIRVMPFCRCNEQGFDQFPAGSNVYYRENLALLTDYCKKNIDRDKLLGIMQTPWVATIEKNREKLWECAETIREARAAFEAEK